MAAPFFYRLNRLARAVSRCRLRFLTDRRQRFIAGSPCVVAPSEFLQHFVKVRGGEYEQPLVLVEHHGRNLAHAHDVAEMRPCPRRPWPAERRSYGRWVWASWASPFDEYRHDRKRRADMKAVHARGEKIAPKVIAGVMIVRLILSSGPRVATPLSVQ